MASSSSSLLPPPTAPATAPAAAGTATGAAAAGIMSRDTSNDWGTDTITDSLLADSPKSSQDDALRDVSLARLDLLPNSQAKSSCGSSSWQSISTLTTPPTFPNTNTIPTGAAAAAAATGAIPLMVPSTRERQGSSSSSSSSAVTAMLFAGGHVITKAHVCEVILNPAAGSKRSKVKAQMVIQYADRTNVSPPELKNVSDQHEMIAISLCLYDNSRVLQWIGNIHDENVGNRLKEMTNGTLFEWFLTPNSGDISFQWESTTGETPRLILQRKAKESSLLFDLVKIPLSDVATLLEDSKTQTPRSSEECQIRARRVFWARACFAFDVIRRSLARAQANAAQKDIDLMARRETYNQLRHKLKFVEEGLLSQFVTILNTKKERIRELEALIEANEEQAQATSSQDSARSSGKKQANSNSRKVSGKRRRRATRGDSTAQHSESKRESESDNHVDSDHMDLTAQSSPSLSARSSPALSSISPSPFDRPPQLQSTATSSSQRSSRSNASSSVSSGGLFAAAQAASAASSSRGGIGRFKRVKRVQHLPPESKKIHPSSSASSSSPSANSSRRPGADGSKSPSAGDSAKDSTGRRRSKRTKRVSGEAVDLLDDF